MPKAKYRLMTPSKSAHYTFGAQRKIGPWWFWLPRWEVCNNSKELAIIELKNYIRRQNRTVVGYYDEKGEPIV